MEKTKNTSVWKTGINYGLVTGLIVVIFMLITYLFEVDRKSYINLLPYIFFIGGIIWGSKTYRDIGNNGYCTYGQALGAGFIVALFASLIVAVFTFFLYYSDTALLNDLIRSQEEELVKSYENGVITLEQYDQTIEFFRFLFTPVLIAIMGFVSNILVNLIFALIVAIFVKKEQK